MFSKAIFWCKLNVCAFIRRHAASCVSVDPIISCVLMTECVLLGAGE